MPTSPSKLKMPLLRSATSASENAKTSYKTFTSPRISPLHNFDHQILKDSNKKFQSEFPFRKQQNPRKFTFSSHLTNFPEVIVEDRKEEAEQVSIHHQSYQVTAHFPYILVYPGVKCDTMW